MSMHISVCVYMYMYMCMYVYIYIYIYSHQVLEVVAELLHAVRGARLLLLPNNAKLTNHTTTTTTNNKNNNANKNSHTYYNHNYDYHILGRLSLSASSSFLSPAFFLLWKYFGCT